MSADCCHERNVAPDRGHRIDRGDDRVLRKCQVSQHHHNSLEKDWTVPHVDDGRGCRHNHDKRPIGYSCDGVIGEHHDNGLAHVLSI